MFKRLISIHLMFFLLLAVGINLASPPESFGASPTKAAAAVIKKIKSGSTDWPFDKDGSVFQNREGKLPAGGSYREYTVVTPKMAKSLKEGKRPNRGKQRIVYDTKSKLFYFTGDHYKSFKEVK